MLLAHIILFGIGFWAVWTGLKICDQVHGIALVLTGLLLAIWGVSLAPLWLQILIELLFVGLGRLLSRWYANTFFTPQPPVPEYVKCSE